MDRDDDDWPADHHGSHKRVAVAVAVDVAVGLTIALAVKFTVDDANRLADDVEPDQLADKNQNVKNRESSL